MHRTHGCPLLDWFNIYGMHINSEHTVRKWKTTASDGEPDTQIVSWIEEETSVHGKRTNTDTGTGTHTYTYAACWSDYTEMLLATLRATQTELTASQPASVEWMDGLLQRCVLQSE